MTSTGQPQDGSDDEIDFRSEGGGSEGEDHRGDSNDATARPAAPPHHRRHLPHEEYNAEHQESPEQNATPSRQAPVTPPPQAAAAFPKPTPTTREAYRDTVNREAVTRTLGGQSPQTAAPSTGPTRAQPSTPSGARSAFAYVQQDVVETPQQAEEPESPKTNISASELETLTRELQRMRKESKALNDSLRRICEENVSLCDRNESLSRQVVTLTNNPLSASSVLGTLLDEDRARKWFGKSSSSKEKLDKMSQLLEEVRQEFTVYQLDHTFTNAQVQAIQHDLHKAHLTLQEHARLFGEAQAERKEIRLTITPPVSPVRQLEPATDDILRLRAEFAERERRQQEVVSNLELECRQLHDALQRNESSKDPRSEDLAAKLQAKDQQLAQLTNDVAQLQQQLVQSKECIAEMESNLNRTISLVAYSELEAEVKRFKDGKALAEQQLNDANTDLHVLKNEVDKIMNELQLQRNKNTDLQLQLQESQQSNKHDEGASDDAAEATMQAQILTAANAQLQEEVDRLIKEGATLRVEQELAQKQAVDTSTKREFELLDGEEKVARLESATEYYTEVLAGVVGVVNDLSRKPLRLSPALQQNKKRVEELEQQLAKAIALSKSSLAAEQQHSQAMTEEFEKLQKELADKEDELAKMKTALAEARARATGLDAALNTTKAQCDALRSQVAHLEQQSESATLAGAPKQ